MSPRSAVVKSGKVAAYAITALILGGVAFVILAPRVTHGASLEVLTGSMSPTIQPGSLVFIRAVDPRELHVGDIATYQLDSRPPALVTHRVIAVQRHAGDVNYLFKGDANNVRDPEPIASSAIRGRVWLSVPYVGELRALAGTRTGYVFLILVPALSYAVGQIRQARRKRRRHTTTGASEGSSDPTNLLQPTVKDAVADATVEVLRASVDSQPPGARNVAIVATLPMATLEGLSPRVVAHLFGGVLLDRDDSSVTLLFAEAHERARQTWELLSSFDPVELNRIEASQQLDEARSLQVNVATRELVSHA